MGVRTEVFLSHDLPHWEDAATTIVRLDAALPAAFAVRDYWDSVHGADASELDGWEAEPVHARLPNVRYYDGPGSLRVTTTSAAAQISASPRWRGFLTIPPLRAVHLAAFRAIARAMGSRCFAICSDARDDVGDVFIGNGSRQACIAQMRCAMGPPHPSIDRIAPEIVAQAEHGSPDVWFFDGELTAD